MIKINQLKLRVLEPTERLKPRVLKLLGLREDQLRSFTIERRSIDARKKPDIFFTYTVAVETAIKDEKSFVLHLRNNDVTYADKIVYQEPRISSAVISGKSLRTYFQEEENRPVVVGFGPAGMFAALLLARAGLRPVVYERGGSVEERIMDVSLLWKEGILNPDSNPQFGEGGAGTFSDGKLNTLVKDKDGRSRFVLNTFVKHGADPEILYDAKPHVGTDHLVRIVKGIREEILSLGGEIHFHHIYHYNGEKNVILAIGHSSRDTYEELYRAGLQMEAKDFAMGFRVQHPQTMINEALYGKTDAKTLAALGPGAYKVTHSLRNGRGVYSFCMCPGGYVVNSSSEPGETCINGMSYHNRDSRNANAAIIVTVRKSDFDGDRNPLGGIALQREVERRAYALADGRIPIEYYGDFYKEVKGRPHPAETDGHGRRNGIEPEIKGASQMASLAGIFRFDKDSPFAALNDYNNSFIEGMEGFAKQIRRFDRPDTILAGVEARTSSPVRIPRNENMVSNIPGMYPCGEGAGYAGGITSAAMDGMKAAEALVKQYETL